MDLTNWLSGQNDQATLDAVNAFGGYRELTIKLVRRFKNIKVNEDTEKQEETKEVPEVSVSEKITTKKVNRILEYPGSKWSIAEWIISHFPDHHSYLEPFFGSGAVLFTKNRSDIETVNDLDYRIYNFFDQVRKDPERLAKEIYMTPYSRKQYEDSMVENPEDDFRKAVSFCININMGYGIRTNGNKTGWRNDVQGRERAYAAEYWKVLPDRIIEAAERLRGVQIENRNSVDVIERFNYKNVLIYADPPYMMETRAQKQYKYEMSAEDHKNLLETLKAHKGPAIISGYESKLYNDVLSGWFKEKTNIRAQSTGKRTEVIWMNFDPSEFTGQMNISDFPGILPERSKHGES